MSKNKKRKSGKRERPVRPEAGLSAFQWMGDDGMHLVAPGTAPTPAQLQKATEEYQKRIRNSPVWDTMVKEFGLEKAEEMLKEFQVKLG
jgi:hypothetical protein